MKIRTKLFLNAALAIMCVLGAGAMGFYFTNNVAKVSLSIVEVEVVPIVANNHLLEVAAQILQNSIIHSAIVDPEAINAVESEGVKLQSVFQSTIKELDSIMVKEGDVAVRQEGEEAEVADLSSVSIQKFMATWKSFDTIRLKAQKMSSDYMKEDALQLLVSQGMESYEKAVLLLKGDIAKHTADMEELKNSAAASRKKAGILIIALTAVIGLGVFIVAGVVTSSITGPLGGEPVAMAGISQKIAKGDLLVEFDKDNEKRARGDSLYMAMKEMTQNLSSIIIKIKNRAGVLASSSDKLSTVSTNLSSGAEEMSMQTNNVAGTTEQMSSNINTIASAVEEMSMNIQNISSTANQMSESMSSVASAIEEMTVSINGIANNSKDGSRISTEAMEMANMATDSMNSLGSSAHEIGQVTEVIIRIAEKTDLLALNATIEAASAGEAGKGFAVVANEIKELANQSSQAAEEIARKIDSVQTNTQDAVKVITDVSSIINSIHEAVSTITNAVDQQTQTASEISATVGQANAGVGSIALSIEEISKGANDMSKNVGEAAKGSNDVASSIQEVNQAVVSSNDGAQEVNSLAGDLAGMANELRELVATFKVQEG